MKRYHIWSKKFARESVAFKNRVFEFKIVFVYMMRMKGFADRVVVQAPNTFLCKRKAALTIHQICVM